MLEAIPFACFGIVEIRRAEKKTERNALWRSMMANLATALGCASFLLLPPIIFYFPLYSSWHFLVTAIGFIPALFAKISQRKVDDKAEQSLNEEKALLQNNAPTMPKIPAKAESASSRLRFKDESAGVGLRPDELDSKTQHKHFGRRRLLLYIVIFSLLAIFLVSVWEAIAELQYFSPVLWVVSITQCILIILTFTGCFRIYLRPDYSWLRAIKGTMYLSVLFSVLSILVAVLLRRFVPQTICATALTLFSIFLYEWLVANTERY
ncbi:hypothetical protein PT279_00165 [Bifidobacterium sp. ESL0784]|uniref:hypothetical protein n=1 Tax=Bifidobacterium sp. ESL0784 TaxID=2983231 RepID=UPI0023F893D7|nr:hypothetical protein [Bifidobacterium sp. ESL0784]MDF7640021.1 hypothetical protein [Bifidobacterium sp. ESL0784]